MLAQLPKHLNLWKLSIRDKFDVVLFFVAPSPRGTLLHNIDHIYIIQRHLQKGAYEILIFPLRRYCIRDLLSEIFPFFHHIHTFQGLKI